MNQINPRISNTGTRSKAQTINIQQHESKGKMEGSQKRGKHGKLTSTYFFPLKFHAPLHSIDIIQVSTGLARQCRLQFSFPPVSRLLFLFRIIQIAIKFLPTDLEISLIRSSEIIEWKEKIIVKEIELGSRQVAKKGKTGRRIGGNIIRKWIKGTKVHDRKSRHDPKREKPSERTKRTRPMCALLIPDLLTKSV